MKAIQSIVIAASIVLVSASVVAGTIPAAGGNDRVGSNTLVMNAASTKQAAYQAGLSKLGQLKTASARQLDQMLHIDSSSVDRTTLHLKNGYITVQERMDASGNISFVSSVNVGFHYLENRTDGNS